MMHGIDISNWQAGIELPEGLDFCLVKATEGTTFVDKCCDGFIQQCKRKGILYGFYHFAINGDPEAQAAFFANNTEGYSLAGVPVLDIESDRIADWGAYAQRFVDKYHAITGVFPLIYASASTLARFRGYPLVADCGLWVAGYPDQQIRGLGDVPKFPYKIAPWSQAAIWQYTNNGRITNWAESVDLDVAYMSRDAWKLYANPQANDHTQVLPAVTEPTNQESSGKRYHFGNSKIDIDVTIKE